MAEKKEREHKKWMVIVYMAGDNNLSESMAGAFKDFGQSFSRAKTGNEVAVLVYFDGSAFETPTYFCDFTNVNDPIINGMPDCDSSDARSLGEFFGWCQEKYTADQHILFLSGHSDGFTGITLFKDDSTGKAMQLKYLKLTLENAMQANRFGKPFDIICFDSCVMSLVEIAFELRKVTKILIASQGFIPMTGLNYRNALYDVMNDPDISPDCFAVGIVEWYIQSQGVFAAGGRSVTLSACRLDEYTDSDKKYHDEHHGKYVPIEMLADKINELGKLLLEKLDPDKVFKKVYDAVGKTEEKTLFDQFYEKSDALELLRRALVFSQWNAQSFLFDQNIDIIDFCFWLESECRFYGARFDEIRDVCEKIRYYAERCVITRLSRGTDYQQAQGISLFFPWTHMSFAVSAQPYRKLEIFKDRKNNWNKFLRMYLTKITATKHLSRIGLGILYSKLDELVKKDNTKNGNVKELLENTAALLNGVKHDAKVELEIGRASCRERV